jgi:hypothetical protein
MLVESGFPCFYTDNNGMVINDGWPGNPGTNRGYIAGKKNIYMGDLQLPFLITGL